MDDDFIFEFSTTPVKLLQVLPNGTISTLKPKCLLLFDQKINRNEILKHLTVGSNEVHRIGNDRLELLDETAAKSEFESSLNANEGNHEKYVAFTFKDDLARATTYTIAVSQGCPSAEGPLTSTVEQSGSFQTYEPLKILDWFPSTKHAWQPSAAPGQSWSVTFNNPLDRSTINKSIFKLEPEVSGLGKFGQCFSISSSKTMLIYRKQY